MTGAFTRSRAGLARGNPPNFSGASAAGGTYNFRAMGGPTSQTQKGHEEPFAVQFSVFLPNRVGRLLDLLKLLAGKGLDVLGISIVDSSDWSVVRLVCSEPEKAREVLGAAGTAFTETSVLLVELPGGAGALADVCSTLLRAELNIFFAYPLAIRSHDNPVVLLSVDDHLLGIDALTRQGYTLLGHEDLAEPL